MQKASYDARQYQDNGPMKNRSAHKFLSAMTLLFGLALGAVVSADRIDLSVEDRSWEQAADRIDTLIADGLKKAGKERNTPIADEVFVRRIYLDISGRIPTYGELLGFLESKSSNKRSELIDELLDSEGYVSSCLLYHI